MISFQQKRLEVADGDMHLGQPFSGFVRRGHMCGVVQSSINEASASPRISWPSSTNNAIELINMGLRKVIKTLSLFPTVDAVTKLPTWR